MKASGFTLIELLIVIAIILILIAIALPNFLEAQIRAKVVRSSADLRTVATAMESYFIDFKMYPPDHDPNAYSERGLYQLTTPLKYLTIVPYDIFNQPGTGVEPGEAFFEMASTGRKPFEVANFYIGRPKVNAYDVYSHGPDHNDNFDGNDSWPCSAPASDPCVSNMVYRRYSPTNGTSSSGDLNQVGGEVRSGNYCIDDWQIIRGHNPYPGC
jgi:prepilin-type N-terminal cleavage/methylation domain-containing protein